MASMVLRDKNGLLKAAFCAAISMDIIGKAPGRWKPWKGKKGQETVFEIGEDCSITLRTGGGLFNPGAESKIYLWQGDMLFNA